MESLPLFLPEQRNKDAPQTFNIALPISVYWRILGCVGSDILQFDEGSACYGRLRI